MVESRVRTCVHLQMTCLCSVDETFKITRGELTVVVPTKNEAANIETFLRRVPNDVSLVVVDASTDATPDIVQRERPKETTRVIHVESNIPMARQIGAAAATTPWLLFTDADVWLHSAYFDRLGAIDLPADCGGIVGAKGTVGGFGAYHRWFIRGQGALMALGIPAASGSNMLVRREALDVVGGFDLELSVNEDTELMFRLARWGWTIEFCPELVALAFDHRRLETGLARKVLHGAVRNTALYLGLFDRTVRQSDWGYWSTTSPRASDGPSTAAAR